MKSVLGWIAIVAVAGAAGHIPGSTTARQETTSPWYDWPAVDEDLRAAVWVDDCEAWVGGDNGAMVHFANGIATSETVTGPNEGITALAWSGSKGYAGTSAGRLLVNANGVWLEDSLLPGAETVSGIATDGERVWASGVSVSGAGWLWRLEADEWVGYELSEYPLQAVTISPTNAVWFAGGGGRASVHGVVVGAWATITTRETWDARRFRDVTATVESVVTVGDTAPASNVWTVTAGGALPLDPISGTNLYGITSVQDVLWIAGARGTIATHSNGGWSFVHTSDRSTTFYDIAALNSDIIAVGSNGAVLSNRWCGKSHYLPSAAVAR